MTFFHKPVFFLLALFLVFLTGCTSQKAANRPMKVDKETGRELRNISLFIDAQKALMLEKFEEATAYFQQLVKLEPDNDAAHYELARLYFRSSTFDRALHHVRQAISASPENKWYLILHAKILSTLGYDMEAIEVYKTILSKFPSESDFYFEWAYLLIKNGKYNEAIQVYDRYEKMTGFDESIALQKQKLYMRLGKIEESANEIEKLIALFPKEIRYYKLLADLWDANDNKEKAGLAYERMLAVDPDNPYAIMATAELYKKRGEYDRFLATITKAFENPTIDIDTKVEYLFSYIDDFQQDEKRKNEAFTLCRAMISAHPEEPKAFALYGDFLYRDDQNVPALKQYQQALKLNDGVFLVWQQVFLIQADLKQFDSLAISTDKALELFPNQPLIYFFNGVALSQQKKYQESISPLKTGARLSSENRALRSQIYATLGDSYHNIENYPASDSAYAAALTFDPRNAYVLNNWSYFLSLRNDQLEKAAEMAALANELEPGSSSYQDTYAWVLYKQGKYAEAKVWIEKALESGGADRPVILDHYGDILFKLGDVEQAVENWKKARDLNLESDVIHKKIADKKLYE